MRRCYQPRFPRGRKLLECSNSENHWTDKSKQRWSLSKEIKTLPICSTFNPSKNRARSRTTPALISIPVVGVPDAIGGTRLFVVHIINEYSCRSFAYPDNFMNNHGINKWQSLLKMHVWKDSTGMTILLTWMTFEKGVIFFNNFVFVANFYEIWWAF